MGPNIKFLPKTYIYTASKIKELWVKELSTYRHIDLPIYLHLTLYLRVIPECRLSYIFIFLKSKSLV